jgi:hypothetical protein
MVTLPRQAVVLNTPPLPEPLQSATAHAHALGLSTFEQVIRLTRAGAGALRRARRTARVVKGAAKQIQELMQRKRERYRVAFVTVTYAPGEDYSPKDISSMMNNYRNWLSRRGIKARGLWVLELQRRGAPHYHLLLWLPRGITPPKPDKQGWWRKGSSNCQWGRKPVAYLASYLKKGSKNGHAVPSGARLYGIFGCPFNLSWYRASSWLRDLTQPGQTLYRIRGGWYAVKELAHAWRCPWRIQDITDSELWIQWIGWGPADVVPIWQLEQ